MQYAEIQMEWRIIWPLLAGSTLSGPFSKMDIARSVVLVSDCFPVPGGTHPTGKNKRPHILYSYHLNDSSPLILDGRPVCSEDAKHDTGNRGITQEQIDR